MSKIVTRRSGPDAGSTEIRMKKCVLRLGKNIPKDISTTIKKYCDDIEMRSRLGLEYSADTLLWLSRLSPKLESKLRKAGYINNQPASDKATIDSMIKTLRPIVCAGKSENTIKTYESTWDRMLKFFGRNRTLDSIRGDDVNRFGIWLQEQFKQPTTISRRFNDVKHMFAHAVANDLLEMNRFQGVNFGNANAVDESRRLYIKKQDVTSVLMKIPDAEIRLIVVLGRFCGLRTPSEAMKLRWDDVDLGSKTIRVTSPKRRGKTRICPLFEAYEEIFEILYRSKLPRSKDSYVIKNRSITCKTVTTAVASAAVTVIGKPWPLLGNNMRASCIADKQDARYSERQLTLWFGNSAAVRIQFYNRVKDDDFTLKGETNDQQKQVCNTSRQEDQESQK